VLGVALACVHAVAASSLLFVCAFAMYSRAICRLGVMAVLLFIFLPSLLCYYAV
jgi:hypothetical protein